LWLFHEEEQKIVVEATHDSQLFVAVIKHLTKQPKGKED
jgi:hypothetical protein